MEEKMKQTPESLDVVIAFLADAMDIRERERGFYGLPADEQTSEAKEALRTDLRARIVMLSDQYGARLKGTVEERYLTELRIEAGLVLSIKDFIRKYDLSTRLSNIFEKLEEGDIWTKTPPIRFANDLDGLEASQMLKWKNMGRKSMNELAYAMEQEGYKLQGIEQYRKK